MNNKCGYLSIFTGPMRSGKSSSLINSLTQYVDVDDNLRCVLITHSIDNRDENNIISSHSSSYKGISPKIKVIKTTYLKDINIDDFDILGVDETQLFTDLVETIKYWLSKNKQIYCSGLDSNWKLEKFGNISDLLHISNHFIKLNAICTECLKERNSYPHYELTPAPFSGKVSGNNNIIEIGGNDKYISVCRFHHQICMIKFN